MTTYLPALPCAVLPESGGATTSSGSSPDPWVMTAGSSAVRDTRVADAPPTSVRRPVSLASYLPAPQQAARLREALARVEAGGGGVPHRGPLVRRRSSDTLGAGERRWGNDVRTGPIKGLLHTIPSAAFLGCYDCERKHDCSSRHPARPLSNPRFDRLPLQRRPSEGGNAVGSRVSGGGQASSRGLPASLAEFKQVGGGGGVCGDVGEG
jgi:hypothetical protein